MSDNPVHPSQVLFEDIKSVYGFQHYILNLRGLILGAGLALMGGIITYTLTKVDNSGYRAGFTIAAIHGLLLGIACSTVRIMGVMNRGQYVIAAYIRLAQKKLRANGFWDYVQEYLKITKMDNDTVTHGFAVAVRQIGHAMCIYVFASSCDYGLIQWFRPTGNQGNAIPRDVTANHEYSAQPKEIQIAGHFLVGVSALAAAVLFWWTSRHVRTQVDTPGYTKSISENMEKAFNALHSGNSGEDTKRNVLPSDLPPKSNDMVNTDIELLSSPDAMPMSDNHR